MLSVLVSQMPDHTDEPVDRDPGLLTLAFRFVRRLRGVTPRVRDAYRLP